MTTADSTSNALRQWLDAVQPRHDDDPLALAAELQQRAADLPADADGAALLRLAEHVALAHLADAARLSALVAAVPSAVAAAAPVAPVLGRLRWSIAQVTGEAAPAPDNGPRWAALHNVALALAQRGQAARAGELLAGEAAAALALGAAPEAKHYAASCNNTALELRLGPRGEPQRDALMLQAATLARRAWASAGTWMNVERADYQLALCHAVLGQGDEALQHARRCLATCEAEGADATERFFAHEALARAEHARGDAPAWAAQHARMAALLAEVPEADGLRAWCAQTLAALPALQP
jgi:hypothetical protein